MPPKMPPKKLQPILGSKEKGLTETEEILRAKKIKQEEEEFDKWIVEHEAEIDKMEKKGK